MANDFITGYRYYYSLLPEHMKSIYRNIYNGLKARRTDFSFIAEKHNGVYPPTEIVSRIVDYVIQDNPALYYVDSVNLQIYYSYNSQGKVRITYTEYYTPLQSRQIEQDIQKRMDPLLDVVRGRNTEYAKVHDLYRYMIATISYDYPAYESKQKTKSHLEAYTIVEPFLRRTAVCSGYTKMFKFLCDQLGIGCFYIRGTANGRNGWGAHAWNVVNLGGKFYHTDVTFDSGHFHANGKYTYNYFLKSDEIMLKDHKWDRSQFPIILDDYRRPTGLFNLFRSS